MPDHIIQAKCVDKAFDSKNAFNYIPGDSCEFNLSTGRVTLNGVTTLSFDRQLLWLKTVGGARWAFEFDRANSSNTQLRIFFCKECGQPFDKFNEMGTHVNSMHNPKQAHIAKTHAENADDEEEQALALLRATEEAEAENAAKVGG